MSTGLTFDQFDEGQAFLSPARTVTETDVVGFAGLSGDFNPLHIDAEFAAKTPFGSRIAHGMLVAAMATGMANWTGIFEGTTLALMEQQIRYTGPVHLGDTVRLKLTVAEKKAISKPDRGIVFFDVQVLNQEEQVVQEGRWTLMMRRQAEG